MGFVQLLTEPEVETVRIEKANQFVSSKLEDLQLLDITKFLSRATSLDSFLKSYKTFETNSYISCEWLDGPDPEKFNYTQLYPL